ncbi:MAG: rhodanese-like domain-containing protein [Spirochaetales bacterium]|nr:rhodanese-like domain-containing protein [Spirochaetales bacterium]
MISVIYKLKTCLVLILLSSLLVFGCTAKASQKTEQGPPTEQKTQTQQPKFQTRAQAKPAQKLLTINAKSAFKLISANKNNNFIIIDVRTPAEYAEGHIKNSRLINFYSLDFKTKLDKLDKNKKYLVYCRSGSRSDQAVQIMKELNFKKIYNLSGGIIAWKNSELPLQR